MKEWYSSLKSVYIDLNLNFQMVQGEIDNVNMKFKVNLTIKRGKYTF